MTETTNPFDHLLAKYRDTFRTKTDAEWADNAHRVRDWLAGWLNLDDDPIERSRLETWMKNQLARVGTIDDYRDHRRAEILNEMPNWTWKAAAGAHRRDAGFYARVAELREFIVAHGRLPDSSRHGQRAGEAKLARWLSGTLAKLGPCCAYENGLDTPPDDRRGRMAALCEVLRLI